MKFNFLLVFLSESTSNMGEHASILYSKIILLKEVDTKSLSGSLVQLEIDKAYTIGKSIAVLKDAVVVGILERRVTLRELSGASSTLILLWKQRSTWRSAVVKMLPGTQLYPGVSR